MLSVSSGHVYRECFQKLMEKGHFHAAGMVRLSIAVQRHAVIQVGVWFSHLPYLMLDSDLSA